MIKYAQIINEQTKQCEVGMGTNAEFYRSVGMTEMEVEQAYDGAWYVKGYAPEKPAEIMQQEIRLVRNRYLQETDKYMIVDYPLTEEERQKVKAYREYLRDYTLIENWWQNKPQGLADWSKE